MAPLISIRRRLYPRHTRAGSSLADRGLRGTRLIIADDHKGLKAAAAKVLGATVQRCRVHFMRDALACVGKKDRPIVTAARRTSYDLLLANCPRNRGNSNSSVTGMPSAV